jgi:hypothetical protein
LLEGNNSLLAESNELRCRFEDLESELVKVCSSNAEDIAALEAKLRSAEAHSVDVAAPGEKCLKDFESEVIKDLVGLRTLYECNVQSIGGLCSLMPESEPLATNYICWLSAEVTDLLKVFAGVNENFVSATIEGTIIMAGDSVDLATLQAVANNSRADILPMKRDV